MVASEESGKLYLNTLLVESARGSRHAFGTLYRVTAPGLVERAFRTLKRRDHAEEVVQDVFIVVWMKAAMFDPDKGAAAAWMRAILRNKCIDFLEREGWTVPLEGMAMLELPDLSPSPFDLVATTQGISLVLPELERLGQAQRDVILSAFFEDLSHSELSRRTGLPLGTVKSWIRRGLAQIKNSTRASKSD